MGRARVTRTPLTESWTSDIRKSLSLPQPSRLHNCTVLFQLSTDDPMWVTVPCTAQLNLGIVICEYDRNTSMPALPMIRATRECYTRDSIFTNGSCYKMYNNRVWKHQHVVCGFCPLCSERLATIQALEALAPYFGRMFGSRPKRVLFRVNDTTVALARSDHYDMTYSDVIIRNTSEHTEVHNKHAEDGLVCEQDSATVAANSCLHGHYRCADGTCILDFYACDGSHDCPDGSDELNCTHVCNFFGRDKWGDRDCFEKCFTTDCSCSEHYFQCTGGKCLPWSFVCNGRDDCRDNSDEVHCSSIVLNNVKVIETPSTDHLGGATNQSLDGYTNSMLNQDGGIPDGRCIRGDDVGACGGVSGECFPKYALCLFEKSPSSGIRYCSQGGHLLSCQNFECPTLFKCPESYCIAMFAVCNGDPDCPNGEDEVGCHIRQCRGLLLCVKDNICVHPNNILDGEVQCSINMDDEHNYHHSKCPYPCDCKGHSVNCATMNMFDVTLPTLNYSVLSLNLSDTHLTMQNLDFENYISLLSLDMSKNTISDLRKGIFKPTARLIFLHLDHNLITTLSQEFFGGLKHLKRLNILHNPLVSIESGAFYNLKNIEMLDLNNLRIFTVMPFSFDGLENCSSLSLSHNNIRTIPSKTFNGIDQLRVLDLRKNPMDEIARDAFSHLEKLNILVPLGQFCCFISADNCEAPSIHAFSFCRGYIKDKKWSIYLCVVAGMILLLNLPAVGLNIRVSKAKFNKLLIILQAMSNILSCLPLVCFVLLDHMLYRGLLFGYSDTRLRKLPACLITSFLFAICFYVPVALSATDMLHKYIIIAHPLKTKRLESSNLYPIWASIFVLITVSLSFLVIIHLSAGELQAVNSSCTAFGHGRNDSVDLVTISALCYCALCLVFMVVITLLTMHELLHPEKTGQIRQMHSTNTFIISRKRRVTVKLILKVVGHSLAPGTFIIFAIVDLTGAVAAADMSILVTSFIFPITPFISPILITLLNTPAREVLFRLSHRNNS